MNSSRARIFILVWGLSCLLCSSAIAQQVAPLSTQKGKELFDRLKNVSDSAEARHLVAHFIGDDPAASHLQDDLSIVNYLGSRFKDHPEEDGRLIVQAVSYVRDDRRALSTLEGMASDPRVSGLAIFWVRIAENAENVATDTHDKAYASKALDYAEKGLECNPIPAERANLMFSRTGALRSLGRLKEAMQAFNETEKYAVQNKDKVILDALAEYKAPGNEFNERTYPELSKTKLAIKRDAAQGPLERWTWPLVVVIGVGLIVAGVYQTLVRRKKVVS